MAIDVVNRDDGRQGAPPSAHIGHDRVQMVFHVARIADLSIVLGAALLAHVLRHGWVWPPGSYLFPILVALMAFGLTSRMLKVYHPGRIGAVAGGLSNLAGAWVGAWALVLLASVLSKTTEDYSRIWLALWLLVAGLGLLLSRVGLWFYILRARSDILHERVLVLRSATLRTDLAALMKPFQIDIVEAIPLSAEAWDTQVADAVRRIQDHARNRSIERVLVAADLTDDQQLDSLFEAMRFLPVPVALLPPGAVLRRAAPAGRLSVLDTVTRRGLSPSDRVTKRLFDIVVGSIILVMVMPLMLLIALAIRLEGPGPVLFRQTRSGIGSAQFTVLKFRSMRVAPPDAPVAQACRDDARITRVGRILRRSSLDELPQLVNVVKGEMSLVGPRPHAIEHDARFAEILRDYMARHHVKPGMTGLAQVSGARGEIRSIDALRRRVDLDLWYIDNWSIWLDLSILSRTAFHMVGPHVF
ncbi:MAG: hypothetical protein RLY86_629 [Pseudomonadota bacterium]|jgi:Undecaprenyl-phosphate glucose phosphotransferase